jgi:hypothetical protein
MPTTSRKTVPLTVEEAILVGTWLKHGAERLQDSIAYLSHESAMHPEAAQKIKAMYATLDDVGDRLLNLYLPPEE